MAIQTAEQRAEAKEAKDLAIKLARLAVVDYFEEAYGNDISKIEALQQLCRDVGVDVGPTIIQCKKNLKGTYINIVDFVADKKEGKPVRTFGSHKALCKYISKNKKVKTFPLDMAKENPILKFMLVQLH